MPINSIITKSTFLNNSEPIYGRNRDPILNPTTLNKIAPTLSIAALESSKLLLIRPMLKPNPPTKKIYPTAPTNSFLLMFSEAK